MLGAAVSASFLFIVGLANSIILYRILRTRYRVRTFFTDKLAHAVVLTQCYESSRRSVPHGPPGAKQLVPRTPSPPATMTRTKTSWTNPTSRSTTRS